ncbi:MAG TPA: NAD(P)H-hydrate dehydratase [Candidatus Bathyarchaeia archaeon]|nr:NAD(P)H-hydrate dehydratase [Candidatus Bathyarchaeia archaeon]
MEKISKDILQKLYRPEKNSHKGQNGRLTIIGGSRLFHGASLWALKTASRIVDMVFYATVPENEELTKKLKSEIYDFICLPREKIEDYIRQSDAVLIGPGLVRGSKKYTGTGESGQQTKKLTKRLLKKFPEKKWIIDAGSLQVMDKKWLKKLDKVILMPHRKEFGKLFNCKIPEGRFGAEVKNLVAEKAREFGCVIVLKGSGDIVCSPNQCLLNTTGNEGMTKGGTGDILAGLVAALACKNDLFLAAAAGAYINGLAGDELYKRVGPYFNTSDLNEEIPKILSKFLRNK